MKISGAEALWESEKPAAFSLFQIGGFTKEDPDPSFDIEVPALLSFLATGSFKEGVEGLNEIQASYEQRYGPGDYVPNIGVLYWSMRVMAYLGTLMFMVAALGAFLYWRGRLESARWFHRTAIVTIAFPFLAATAGWVLTEIGRQPWIVQGLLKTSEANSPAVSTEMLVASLVMFVVLYTVLGVVDFVLMRRYARTGPPRGLDASGRAGARAGPVAMSLPELWFLIIAFFWAGYFLLEGFDFGVGALLPFLPRNEADRRAMFDAIGPLWDGNEVWLVVAGGATFAAFPAWYATAFSGFYLALVLVLFFLIIRVVSFESARQERQPAGAPPGAGRTPSAVWEPRSSGGLPSRTSCTACRSTGAVTSQATCSISSTRTRSSQGW